MIKKYKYLIILIAVVIFASGYFIYYCSQTKNEISSLYAHWFPVKIVPKSSMPPNTSVSKGITRGDSDLVLLSLNDGEVLVPGLTYPIEWSWSDQITKYYTNIIRICLLGISNEAVAKKQVYILDLGNVIPAKSGYNDPLCTYMSGSLEGSYLIASTTISSSVYNWTVPADIANRFVTAPDSLRVELIAFDDMMQGMDWGGAVGWSMSAKPLRIEK